MRQIALALCLAFVGTAFAKVVGSFDETRLYSADKNLQTGSNMTEWRAEFMNQGATIVTTPTITPDFLATIDVFVTSHFSKITPSTDEVNAMKAWVQAGGTLVVTGDCG